MKDEIMACLKHFVLPATLVLALIFAIPWGFAAFGYNARVAACYFFPEGNTLTHEEGCERYLR